MSPFFELIVTGTISSGMRPSSVAAMASSWLRSANLSMSGRVISSSAATSVASSAMCLPLQALTSPSLSMQSSALPSPMRKPKRAFFRRYGAWDMDSMPPATAMSRSPARIAWSTIPAERRPDAQTLLMVSEVVSLGMPALIWAWREGIWPCPAWSTCPKTTCWTCSGATSARSRAPAIATPPRSVASSVLSAPPIFPNGVRAVPRITVLAI